MLKGIYLVTTMKKKSYCIMKRRRTLLGTVHGRFNGMRVVRLLRDALHSHASPYPKKLWLIAPEGDCEWIGKYLEKSES